MFEHKHYSNPQATVLSKSRLIFVIIFNIIIVLAEIIGGIFSGSLSLISDAVHNSTDIASVILSYITVRISEKPKNKNNTFGYKRANIISAFLNSAVLIGIVVYLMLESFKKFIYPSPVKGNIVIIIALIGLLGNILSVLLLKRFAKANINIKSSYLHLISDSLSSVAVIISGLIIKYTAILWVDPFITILIGIIVARSGLSLLKKCINILMQSTPSDIDIDKVTAKILSIEGVMGIHHIHVWMMDEKDVILEGHIRVRDMLISKSQEISDRIKESLQAQFQINHTVLQFESIECNNSFCKI
jgi:cobalt-zinc-cadmium efflux system protein